jgi:hypothetical protein
MKQAIKVEKSILRFRLAQIRNWALKRLRDIRQKSNKVYTKLEDWIYVANKAENDAVDEMVGRIINLNVLVRRYQEGHRGGDQDPGRAPHQVHGLPR